MADIALDAEALRRDRHRYARLLEQAERQRAALSERVDGLRQAVDGFDRLLALAGDDGNGGVAPEPRSRRRAPAAAPPETRPEPAAAAGTGALAPGRPPRTTPPPPPPKAGQSKRAAPPPTSTPAAPDPVEPPAAEAPKGTDAVRLVLECEPGRTWALPELLEVLGARGWLPTSRRPEEGVRISLKRLAERGGVARTEDGRWRLAANGSPPAEAAPADGTWPPAEPPPATTAPAAQAGPVEEHPPAPEPGPPVRPASFGRPVGGTITEL